MLKIFQIDSSPNQIALGAALGLFLGIVPSPLIQCALFVIIILVKVNIKSALIAAIAGFFAAFMLDPLSDKLGYAVLTADALNPLWTYLYNVPIAPLTRFNNTVVMGSIVMCIILFAPVFIVTKKVFNRVKP